MRRISKEKQRPREGAYRFGEFDLYPSDRQLRHRQKPVRLAPKAFDALLLLARHAEQLVRRDELIEALWPDTYVTEANLTNVIVSLRKILGRDAIETVSKFGYRFRMRVLGEPGVSQETYATFLQAKALAAVRSLDAMARARDLFSLCVAGDPLFAAAWAWLGRCCRFLDKFTAGTSVNVELAQAMFKRALAIDPHLACAHHFYTQLQADLGQSREAMVRLARRIAERGDEPESLAGLVQVLRFCGLLDESVAAHERATALDPTIVTSISHTYFLRGEYEATLETYGGTGYYLDAAAWAALGDAARAKTILAARLRKRQLSEQISGMMSSLLAILEGRNDRAMEVINGIRIEREPEVTFYVARHLALIGAASQSVRMLQRARTEGFTSQHALTHDKSFARLRHRHDFRVELARAQASEAEARRALEEAGGGRLMQPFASAPRRSMGVRTGGVAGHSNS